MNCIIHSLFTSSSFLSRNGCCSSICRLHLISEKLRKMIYRFIQFFSISTLTLLTMLSQFRVAGHWLCPNSDQNLFFHSSGSLVCISNLCCPLHSGKAHQIYYVLKMVPMQWFQRVSYIHVTQQTLGLPGTHPVQVTSSRKNWVTCLWVSMTTYT